MTRGIIDQGCNVGLSTSYWRVCAMPDNSKACLMRGMCAFYAANCL